MNSRISARSIGKNEIILDKSFTVVVIDNIALDHRNK